MNKVFFAFLALALCTNLAAYAATSNQFSEFEFEEDNSLPIVYLNIVIDSGGGEDPEDKIGLANVASHMLLRGTQKHTKNEFNELLNMLGGEFEVDVRDEGTVFRGAVLSENLGNFLSLIEEALSKPKFTAGELAKIKKEIEGQILERKSNDKALVQQNYYEFLYGKHPYGKPTIGTQAGVKNINSKDIVNYFVQHFGGRTMRLFGTGAAKSSDVEKWFSGLTSKLSALHPEAVPVADVAKPEIPKGRRALIVDKPKATQAQALMGGPGIKPENPGFYPISLANYTFGGHSFQARLMQEIRAKRGWTYGASNAFRFGRQPKHFAMYVFPKTDDTAPAIDLEIKLFEDWVKNGITRDEFAFARDSLVNNAPFNYDTSKKRLENLTTEYLQGLPRDFHRNFAKNVGNVSYGDVAPALRSFFDPSNLTLTVVGDAQKLREPLSKLPGFSAPIVKSYLED